MSKLILVRHGQSLWNKLNLFTGWVDVPLTDNGCNEAKLAAKKITECNISTIFVSGLFRAQETAMIIAKIISKDKQPIIIRESNNHWQLQANKTASQHQIMPLIEKHGLNERYYGDLQGLNKQDTINKYGEKQVHIWRRSYDISPPNGESLAETANRSIKVFVDDIVPKLKKDKNILVVAHGNSLRALIMFIEKISKEEISTVEIQTACPIFYEYKKNGEFEKSC